MKESRACNLVQFGAGGWSNLNREKAGQANYTWEDELNQPALLDKGSTAHNYAEGQLRSVVGGAQKKPHAQEKVGFT